MGELAGRRGPVRVIGLGNPDRCDDGVGRFLLGLLDGRLPPDVALIPGPGEATALLELWRGTDLAIVLDAVRSGRPPGTVVHWSSREGPLPPGFAPTSTHALSVREAVGLAAAVDALPRELRLVGVEGGRFEIGRGLTPEVEAGARRAADRLVDELSERGHARHA